MRISVIGAGYVGLITGLCLAEKGHQIICVDLDQEKVEKINHKIPPIYEKGLEKLLRKNINRNLKAITDIHKAVLESDVSFIAVGTPFNGGQIDLRYIKEASQQIGMALKEKNSYHLIVVKSTVVPGTTDEIVLPILEMVSGKKAGVDFGVGMNPEFLREGKAVDDFMFPDRIVLGGIDKKSIEILCQLYNVFPDVDKVKTNNKTAEMIKYTSNSLLATMISFSNEIANLCTAIGDIDVVDVMNCVHMDKRLSPILPDGQRIVPPFTTYLEAGCGFGGSCLPKDVKALIAHGKKLGAPTQVLNAVMRVNEHQPKQIVQLLKRHFPLLAGIRIAILGLAFKPGTDDMRESPSITVINDLLFGKAKIKAYDPAAKQQAQALFDNEDIVFCDDLLQTIENVEAIVILTCWDEFAKIPDFLTHLNMPPVVIDGRRMLDKCQIKRYEGIGL